MGQNHSDMNDDMEGEENEDVIPELLVLEQAPSTRNNGGAATAWTGVDAEGSSSVWSLAFRSAGGSTGSGAGGAQGCGTDERYTDAWKELTAATAKVKRRVRGWRMNTPSKAKEIIW